MMKKVLAVILTLCIVLGLCACGSEPKETTPGSANGTQAAEKLNFSGSVGVGSLGSTNYILATAFSELVSGAGINLSVQTTGGNTDSMNQCATGQMKFGFFGPDAPMAVNGEGDFTGMKDTYKDIRVIFAWPSSGIQYLALASSGFTSIADMKGKSINLGAAGSTSATYVFPNLLKVYGIDETNSDLQYLGTQAAADAVANGSLAATTCLQKEALSQMATVALTQKITVLTPQGEYLDRLLAAMPDTFKIQIDPVELYGNVSNAPGKIDTLGAYVYFGCSADVPEAVVYTLTKAIFENLEEMRKTINQAKDINFDYAMNSVLPYHDGAIKYYQEVGQWKK